MEHFRPNSEQFKEIRIQVNMSNQTFFLHDDLSWASGDLQIYDNQSGFASSVIFTIVNSVIALMTFIVHKAVYKLLAKLPDRSINQIIYPSMVSGKSKQCAQKISYFSNTLNLLANCCSL